ncbi:hypothetical protein Bca52824_066427 [Brassica carinata]|uniref:Uncharacterized protein n=1 Tax=Brassica carinata TaxID=52824 RepID=A0A8X7QLV2_BRACI|nr:hypothetical protein Bca52824_066427 [Brassica carinata]
MEKEVPEWFSSSLASLLVFDGKTKGVKSRDSPPPTLSSSSLSITHEVLDAVCGTGEIPDSRQVYVGSILITICTEIKNSIKSTWMKSFNEDKFLDQHFATRHFNLLNTTGTKCLADLCGALHCDFVLSSKKAKSKCNPAAAAKNRHL